MVERRSRLPVAGRIRSGVKVPFVNNKGENKIKPVAIETFRFTCRRRDDIDILAGLYGGTVRPWSDPKSEDKWEVVSEATEIRVILPPDPLGDSFYELWTGKGLRRRCDGVTSEQPRPGPEGIEWWEGECVCRQRGIKECKPKLRLQLLLPELPLRGTWRFDTSSDQALDELPGMVQALLNLQGEGLTRGLFRLERRQSQGGAQQFIVPALGIAESLEGLIAGRARLAALPAAEPGPGVEAGFVRPFTALPPGPDDDKPEPGWGHEPLDDEVVDAELVDEPSPREKALQLKAARSKAILEGHTPPTSWEEIPRG
jgi:hypothetical protein